MAEFVVLDLPNQPSAATQVMTRLCHFVGVVTDRALGSIFCAQVALNQLQSWGVDGNLVGTVIVNRVDSVCPMELSEIRTRLRSEIVGVCHRVAALVLMPRALPPAWWKLATVSAADLVGMKF